MMVLHAARRMHRGQEGGAVDTEALTHALEDKRPGGAGLDVTMSEPPRRSDAWCPVPPKGYSATGWCSAAGSGVSCPVATRTTATTARAYVIWLNEAPVTSVA